MKRERALKIVLVVVGLLFCAGVYPLVLMAKQDPAAGDDDESLRNARHLLAACFAQPLSAPQPDRFHGMVKLCSRRAFGGAGAS
jgi:hypothetical protein